MTDDKRHVPERDGCSALVALAAGEAVPGLAPRRFVRRLGHAGAGVRPGMLGLLDLARGGRNTLPGHGFRHELADGTGGQVRHFCGLAAACDRFGPKLTWWLSVHLRRDAPDTPDGRLTDLAIEFVGLLYRGDLDVGQADEWLRRTLCDPGPALDPEPGPGTGPDDAGPGATHV